MSDAPSDPSPFATGALDGAVLVFAAFTLVAHAFVALGRSLDELLVVCGALLVAALAGWGAHARRGGRVAHATAPALGVVPPGAHDAGQPRLLRLGLLGGALVAATAGGMTESVVAWWACALAVFGVAALREARLEVTAPPASRNRWSDILLVTLSLGLAFAAAIAHRADADDSFYVNLIVAALDHPGAPLLAGDTLHGYPDVPMALPVFRLLTWEIAQAGVARIVAAEALTVAHVAVPPLVAVLIPLAIARLAMRLLPRTWPVAVTFVVLGLLMVGDGRAGHGDFGLLRLQQGKSVMLLCVLPLCTAYAIEYGLAPSRAGLLRLAAAQIAAVGLSASGLWLGPVAAGLGLLTAAPLRPRAFAAQAPALAVGLAASAYPVMLALALRGATVQAMRTAPRLMDGAAWTGPRLMEHATDLVLGSGPYRWIALFALVAATALTAAPLMRRFAAASGAVFVGLLFNPLTASWVANGVTGADTYFRIFWALPLPIFVAAVLTEPLRAGLPARLAGARARAVVTAIAAALVLGLSPQVLTLSPANGVRLAVPGPKLPPTELAAARTIAAHAGPEDLVLAPLAIARWIPLLASSPRALMVRELYLDRLDPLLGTRELDRRRALAHLVGGAIRPREGAALLAEAIDDYPLTAVCVAGPALDWPEVGRVLRESPLEVVERAADHQIWARPAAGRR